MQAQFFGTGQLSTAISISNFNISNLTGSPRSAVAYFVIDGGSLSFVADTGSNLSFFLKLDAVVRALDGHDISERTWETYIDMVMTPNGGFVPEVTTSGVDIGATTGALPFVVDIPKSQQSFDLGVVPVTGHIALTYEVAAIARVQGFAENVAWQFSDPLSVDGPSQFPTVEFLNDTTVSQVPAPASLPLVAAGLAGLGLCRRRKGLWAAKSGANRIAPASSG
jgi:hypothetical protein